MTEITSLVCRDDQHGRVATLTLNRPETLNALTENMLIDLLDKLRIIESDAGVVRLLLQAPGKGFAQEPI